MSYDITIGEDHFNYTYNLSAFFGEHIDGGLDCLHGKTGKECLALLRVAWDGVHSEYALSGGAPALCAKYDNPSGWGSTVGALIFMGQLTASCAKYPRHKVSVT